MGMDLRPHDSRAHMLLEDDTEPTRDLVEAVLMAACFAVDVAGDGETAWELTWGRACYATVWRQDRASAPPLRTRISVQSLFGARRAA